jgi:hypothetical protein
VRCQSVNPVREGQVSELFRLWKPIAASAIAAGTALAVAASASAAPVPPAPRMSAVTLADGVLFGQGPAARYLTSFSGGRVAHRAPMRLVEAVDHAINSRPALAAQLSSELQSGNRIEVSHGLTSLARLMYATLRQLYGTGQARNLIDQVRSAAANVPDKTGNDGVDAVRTNVNFVFTVGQGATVLQVAAFLETVVISAVFVVSLAVIFAAPAGPSAGAQLRAQQFVNTIAMHLKAA